MTEDNTKCDNCGRGWQLDVCQQNPYLCNSCGFDGYDGKYKQEDCKQHWSDKISGIYSSKKFSVAPKVNQEEDLMSRSLKDLISLHNKMISFFVVK